MGLHKFWQVTWVIVSLFLSCFVECSITYDRESLDAVVREHANKEIVKPRTGIVYNISIAANFAGMEVSVVRVHTASFWLTGVNLSFFSLPPRIVPDPKRKRMAIVCENLDNWSSRYYSVPNYIMVGPVLGFMAYSSSETSLIGNEKMNFSIQGNPIKIRFPQIGLQAKDETPICVQFGADGLVEFNNMTEPYVCITHSQGHYTLIVPSPKAQMQSKNPQSQNNGFIIWGVLGFVICFVGLVILALVLVATVEFAKRRRIRKTKRNSEKGELFDTFWIGEAKLPSASMTRTQPVFEKHAVPP